MFSSGQKYCFHTFFFLIHGYESSCDLVYISLRILIGMYGLDFTFAVTHHNDMFSSSNFTSRALFKIWFKFLWIPVWLISCPKKLSCFLPNTHYASLSFMPYLLIYERNILRFSMCFSSVRLAITASSRCTKQKSKSRRSWSMNLWKVWAALLKLYGIRLNLNNPNGNRGFKTIFQIHGDLVICPLEIYFAENFAG